MIQTRQSPLPNYQTMKFKEGGWNPVYQQETGISTD